MRANMDLNQSQLLELLDAILGLTDLNPTNAMERFGRARRMYLDPGNDLQEDGRNLLELLIGYCEQAVRRLDSNDPVKVRLQNWFLQKDAEVNPSWPDADEPSTLARRRRIFEEFAISASLADRVNEIFPPFVITNVLVADDHDHWLTPQRKDLDGFYGPSVLKALRCRGYREETITSIDQATDQILDYIADPRSTAIHAARGLVVGYVQSGKTTNINVLIAKAIDSGYRLIIILAGMTDVLRTQTQRRVDKEVVGKSLIETDPAEAEGSGYRHHDDWADFIEHEPRPGRSVGPPIERLTTRLFDFSSVRGGTRFTNDWAFEGTSARIVVIKKNASRLEKLCSDILTMNSDARQRIPALVIDDESDQASVNTKRPVAGITQERTTINKKVVKLLGSLGRAQYIGYTATPFANVLVNPDEPEGLFPGDFVVSLAQPLDYMGVRAFHDLDEDFLPVEGLRGLESNRDRHVRDIDAGSGQKLRELLEMSIDTFVLAGALKIYRQQTLGLPLKHHTYFHSESIRVRNQESAAQKIQEVWENAGYNTVEGLKRLENLYETDIKKHSEFSDDERYFPSKFSELIPCISEARNRINKPFGGVGPVLVVNGEPGSVAPDFEMDSIWKFVVGGAKLSRGYTIEGLTVTFFRRKSNNQSALLQMGRWFGYRHGYQDLVRLYISRAEGSGKQSLDLYKAFEAICRDEEAFRRELQRYSIRQPDGTRFKPRDIPPLVQSSHPQLMPAARNMMWNARLTARNFGLRLKTFEDSSIDPLKLKKNEEVFRDLLVKCGLKLQNLDAKGSIKAYVALSSHGDLLQAVSSYEKDLPRSEEEKLFMDFLGDSRCEIDDWAIILPQSAGRAGHKPWQVDNFDLEAVGRSWNTSEHSFGPVGEPRHRHAGYAIAGIPRQFEAGAISGDIQTLAGATRRAALLLYPIRPINADVSLRSDLPALGFEYFVPTNSLPEARFEPRRTDRPGDLVVPIA